LTIIIGYTELLARGLAKQEQRQLVADIEGATRRAAVLTQQMLGMTRRSDAGVVTDLSAELAGLEGVLNRLAGPKVTVAINHAGEPVTVQIAPSELEQIVVNLVINACDAIQGFGRVTVDVSLAAPGTGTADQPAGSTLADGPTALLTVADDGPGMSPEVLARCLEPFYTTKPRGEGSGLGLSTVDGLVNERGGVMHVDSSPGRGTSIRIWFSLCDAAAAGSKSDDAESESWPPGQRISGTILFVEDDDDLRQMGCECLETIGCRVVTAPSAEAALDSLALAGPFDALVTDIMLPGMSGVELVNAAREALPDIPVLYMTGYSGSPLVSGMPAPGARILRKPYRPDALRLRVAELLHERTLQGSKR
jgi:CheY-like chemotaxis protein